ncbi:MAG: protoporphyrinogen oxidase [Thermaceae bacterium]|nr:protoporphyrinogen oxidase [Thermaceae bacterium]
MSHLIIVGGGISGLSAAYYAQQAAPHLKITLLEADSRLGGKVRTVAEDGFVLEGGPDAVVRYKPWAVALMKALGLEAQMVGTLPTKPSALIHDGHQAQPIPPGLQMVIPGDLWAMVLSPLLSPFGKARAALDLAIARGPAGDEPFGAFIQRRLGKQVWERLVAPLSGGIYGGDPYALSTLAAFPQLKTLEQSHGSLIRGAMQQHRERGSREAGQLFASLSGGLGNWVEVLQQRVSGSGLEIRLNTGVERLERLREGWRVHAREGVLEADAIVLTTPAPSTARLLQNLHPEAAAALQNIPYGSSATVSLAFPKAKLPARVGHGMLIAANSGFGVRGFTWTDQKWSGRAPQDYALVRAYFSDTGLDEHSLTQQALTDLGRLWGQIPTPQRTWTFRWQEGLPQYTVGHLERVTQALQAETLPGLFLAGAAYHGVGLPEVVRMGQETALRALAFLSGTAAPSADEGATING